MVQLDLLTPEQEYSLYIRQVEEQPSPLARLLSSQALELAYLPTRTPSPQIGLQVETAPLVFVQAHRGSTVQSLRHPVLVPRAPESQTSPASGYRRPLPQTIVQFDLTTP